MRQKSVVFLICAALCGALIPSILFAYEAAPIAITKAATFITEKSANLNAEGNPSEVQDAVGWFEWGISGRGDIIYETAHQSVYSHNTLVSTYTSIIGLAPDTQYFYRYVIESSRGKNIGQTVYFSTKKRAPTVIPLVIVETNAPAALTMNSVEMRGYVSPHGDARTTAWFEWGTTMRLESQTSGRNVSGSAGSVSDSLNNLTPGTAYFYRIVAENASGRTYGATRVFTTTGVAPAPIASEQPITQYVPSAGSGDGVVRTTTTSGKSGAGSNNTIASPFGPQGLPTFGSFFRKKSTSTTSNTEGTVKNGVDQKNQTAGVAAATSPLGTFWNNLTGKSLIEVTIEKVGPKNVSTHTPIEYLVTYSYGEGAQGKDARLMVTLPKEVIYIGDNTANELLVQEEEGGERTYVLPLGTIQKGNTRAFSLLGMTTGGASGFPDARARLEYENTSGMHIVEASAGKATSATSAKSTTAAKADSSTFGLLPSSVLGWFLYTLLIIGAIIGVRKGKIYYEKRKAEIRAAESETREGGTAILV